MMDSTLFRRIDWQLAIPVGVLSVISLTTLFSINVGFFRSQLIFTFISIIFFLFFSHADLKLFRFLELPIYGIACLSLLFLLFLGFETRGAVRWIDIGGFRIQFSEIFKPFLLIILASFLSQKNSISFGTLVKTFAFLLPVVFLIFRQPDLGSAMIYMLTVVTTLIIYGFPLWWFGVGVVVIMGSIPLVWQFLHEYQRQRVLTFLRLTHDPLGTSYNAIQAVIAVGSGMFFGKGLGEGTQSALRFLPEKQTDFIFATLSEDLGFIGGVIVIIAFVFLLYRFYSIFTLVDDAFEKVFVAGAFSLILVQVFINIGMNIGLLPIVGVTLPFVSYGGSSLVSNAILLGMVSGIGSMVRKKHVLEIR